MPSSNQPKTAGLLIGRLCISYDRGTARNNATDLGLVSRPTGTQDGKIVRGLGSHFRSADAEALAQERSNEEGRIRDAFKRAFVSAPFPGTFILATPTEGRDFLAALDPAPRKDVRVSVEVYTLGVIEQAPEEITRWGERVSKQLAKVPLGRGKQAGGAGLKILEQLAGCPVITEESRGDLLALIEDAKLERVNRVDFRRKLAEVKVQVAASPVAPRRAPVAPADATGGDEPPKAIRPRRRRRPKAS
jgi:hypothetical protein